MGNTEGDDLKNNEVIEGMGSTRYAWSFLQLKDCVSVAAVGLLSVSTETGILT